MIAVVGLTGGIACGKSTVAGFFAELGVPVVDADQISREVVEPGSAGLAEIIEAFGREVLSADGTLDRKALGALVFADEAKRRRLETITHPRIAARSMQRFGELAARGDVAYGIYEAALLVENGSYKMFAALVVVSAPPEVQLARVMQRDRLDALGAQARIDAQAPLKDKEAVADHVIFNDADMSALRERTIAVHGALVSKLSGSAARAEQVR